MFLLMEEQGNTRKISPVDGRVEVESDIKPGDACLNKFCTGHMMLRHRPDRSLDDAYKLSEIPTFIPQVKRKSLDLICTECHRTMEIGNVTIFPE